MEPVARLPAEVVVIGAGPAGLMAAAAASAVGRRVRVCEHMETPGRKLLATGGGRCNLTNTAGIDAILAAFGRQGRFLQPALREFPPEAIRAFFAAAGVPTLAQADGCVFPVSQRARDVLQALRNQGFRHGVEIACNCAVRRIVVHDHAVAGVETTHGFLPAPRVILAAGGRSYPKLGSDGSGFGLAAEAGHTLVAPVPALVPLITVETWPTQLAGIVLEAARVRIAGKGQPREERVGPVLFTHRGVSGPPVLDLSGAVAARLAAGDEGLRGERQRRAALQCEDHSTDDQTTGGPRAVAAAAGCGAAQDGRAGVPLLLSPRIDRNAAAWRSLFDGWRASFGKRAMHNLLAGELPRALAQILCEQTGLAETTPAQARREQIEALARLCAELPLTAAQTEGWEHAMVTRGGVALGEVDPHTLQSRRVPGLYFAGEVLDLDGPCGGYNLTWALASGRLAGISSAREKPLTPAHSGT